MKTLYQVSEIGVRRSSQATDHQTMVRVHRHDPMLSTHVSRDVSGVDRSDANDRGES